MRNPQSIKKFVSQILTLSSLIFIPLICVATVPYPLLMDQFVEDVKFDSKISRELHQQVAKLFINQEINKAIALINQIVSTELSTNDLVILKTNLGVLYGTMGENDQGIHVIDQTLELIKTENGVFTTRLYRSLIVKAHILKNAGSLEKSANTFRYAQNLLHRSEGVYTINQLAVIEQLSNIDILQNENLRSDREQRFYLLISEKQHGKYNINLIPALNKVAEHFLQRAYYSPQKLTSKSQIHSARSALFFESLRLYDQVLLLTEKKYGKTDTKLIEPLKNLTRARILQGGSAATAEKYMERAHKIITGHPDSDSLEMAQITIDLADVYTKTSDPRASITYAQAWDLLSDSNQRRLLRGELFNTPNRIYPENILPLPLERLPSDADADDFLYVEFEYDVNDKGRVYGIETLASNVPSQAIKKAKLKLQTYRFRPRIIEGKPVATENLFLRQPFLVFSGQKTL